MFSKDDTPMKKKMRIGIFTYDFVPWEGGMGRHVQELNNYLSKLHDIEFLIFSPCRNNLKNHIPLFTYTKKVGKNVLFSVLLNLFLRRISKKYQLDTIHLHTGAGGLFLFRNTFKKLMVTIHTNNYLHQFRHLKKLSKLLLYPLERHTYQIADKIVSVSTYIKSNLIKDYNIPPEKIRVIPNGVSTESFKPIPEINKKENTILFVGRIDRRKGIEFLIDALEVVIKGHPNLSLIVAGEGKYKKNIEKHLVTRKNPPRVDFLGHRNDAELRQLYNRAFVCVMPSIIEGFGLTILEAMACGCPVIATDSGGGVDIIQNGQNGLLVSYGNVAQLSNSLINLLESPTLRRSLAKKGLETVHSGFTWENISEQYRTLYTSFTQS